MTNSKPGPCIDCKLFAGAESFQKFGWFGLRRDVETTDSIRFGQCLYYLDYASIARTYKCRGRDFERKENKA